MFGILLIPAGIWLLIQFVGLFIKKDGDIDE